jgi:hypothetical protein
MPIIKTIRPNRADGFLLLWLAHIRRRLARKRRAWYD